LSVLPQLIQHFVIYTTPNKDHFETNPPPYKCNKLVPNTTPHFAIACHKTCVTRQGKPPQIPEYDAVPWHLGSASDVTMDDVEVLKVREEGFGIGGRHYGVKRRWNLNPFSESESVTPVQPQALYRIQRPK
jgi:hypothetical protein